MTAMLSIDFGNSYTKIALRPTEDKTTVLARDKSLIWDGGLEASVPTVAARYDADGGQKWVYGTDVMRFRSDTPGLTVYRNWKPQFFQTPDHAAARKPAPSAILPPPPGITSQAWIAICRDYPPAKLPELWKELGGNENPDALPQAVPVYRKIAVGYFRWLREFFEPVCKQRLKKSIDQIPVRISLPSFGGVARSEQMLKEMLVEAGWRPDTHAPTLPEPLSNSIGIFTEGANAINKVDGDKFPHLGVMFSKTGLLEQIRGSFDDGPKTVWVLIADIGGYTTDFAMLGLDLQDISARLDGKAENKPRLSHLSTSLGVTDLDHAVASALPEAKRAGLEKLMKAPDQAQLEAFHAKAYGGDGKYAITGRLVLGNTAKEQKTIRDEVERFAENAADDAEKFLSIHQYPRVDELILTGGGTLIPAVQQALLRRISTYKLRMIHFYKAPDAKWENKRVRSHFITKELSRGATAFGGASVYFDYSEK